ncbi:hypothetical protein V3C99_002162 [Haemonchus contortus]
MFTSDTSLVVDTTSPCGRLGSSLPSSAAARANAILSLSTFRSRLGTEMNEIIPNLYLGSLRDAIDAEQLKKHRIKYVVSVHDLTASHPAHDQLKVLRIQLSDCSSSDISSHFSVTNQFIHSARLKHAAVLVHCLAGVSRSATVVAAYLITVCDLSFLNALSLIAQKRPMISPNFGFRMQLCTYADRHAANERQRLRELFGASAFDAQWAADRAITRSKIDQQPVGIPEPHCGCVKTSRTAFTSDLCTSSQVHGPSASTAAPLSSQEAVVGTTTVQGPPTVQKVVVRTVPLPQVHRVQMLTLAQPGSE